MADKNQGGLFPEVRQDTTGISNDSEHNSQLLIVRLIEPKSPQRARIRKWCHLQKMNSLRKERKEIWLTLQLQRLNLVLSSRFCPLFSILQLFRLQLLFKLIAPVIFGYVTFHIFVSILFFHHCFYCLVQLFLSLVFQLPLSLRFSRRSRHTNLVSFLIFRHFCLFYLYFVLVSRSVYLAFTCVCFQRIASKSANIFVLLISTTRLSILLCSLC